MSQLRTSEKSKGGIVTSAAAILRQSHVERLMKMGYSLTRITSTKVNGKKLGAVNTISKDMDIIRSRWLEQDPSWFHRARLARIEAVQRLTEQLVRMNELILQLKNGDYNNEIKSTKEGGAFVSESNADLPRKLTYAESQLTTIISKIYEIDADFDPEQYIDQKIRESINHKVKAAETETS